MKSRRSLYKTFDDAGAAENVGFIIYSEIENEGLKHFTTTFRIGFSEAFYRALRFLKFKRREIISILWLQRKKD